MGCSSIWRWAAVFAKFVIYFLAFGIYKSFGVLLPYLVRGLETDVTSVGWGFGMYGGLVYLLGPVAGALTRSYGARRMVISGGFIAATGLASASLSTSPVHLCLALTCSGLGHGLSVLPSVEPIVYHFPEGFALANGIALGGASVGMMVLPPVLEKFVELYGWRGTLLLLGALDLHIVFAGALMRMPQEHQSTVSKNLNVNKKEKRLPCNQNEPSKSSRYIDLKVNNMEKPETEGVYGESTHERINNRIISFVYRRFNMSEKSIKKYFSKADDIEADDTNSLIEPAQKQYIKQNCATRTRKQTVNNEDATSDRSLKDFLVESFDVKFFGQEPLIIFYDVVIFFFAFTYGAWTVYLVPHAIDRGVNAEDAALLSTVAGFTNFFGRIAYAPVIDKDLIDPTNMFAIGSLITSFLFLCDPLFDTYLMMSLSAAIAGLVIGSGNSLWTVMIKQFVDESGTGTFISALGWACLFSGVGCMISSPLTGWLFDKLNDYELVFQMMGCVSAVIFVILCAVKITRYFA
ncbi:monocarboxylate transporter 2-like [Amphiura filiformis]|uniref:monocarboxylate transporter 2-like n=1 Tax=Amphiura filiformis TaxID=82378 RepID=UPI003B216201